MALDKNQIAQRIAQELEHNTYINLGIGIPTLVANYIPKGIDIEFQSENGVLGMGSFPYEGEEDPDMINAGKQTITTVRGAVLFDSAISFNFVNTSIISITYFLFGSGCGLVDFDRGLGVPSSSLLIAFSFSFGASLFTSLSFSNSFNRPMFAFVLW